MQAPATFPNLLGPEADAPSETTPPERPAPNVEPSPEPMGGEEKSFAASLLAAGPQEASAAFRDGARKFAVGLGLSAAYGLAIGTRDGGLAILKHAAAVPLAPLAVACLGVPALFIVLTLFDAPVEPPAAVSAAARGAATTGLVLGGLAPAMALFVTTSSSRIGAAFCAGAGLILGGLFGLRAFMRAIGGTLAGAKAGVRTVSGFALAAFAIFGTALSARVWWSTLPIFGGAP